MQAGDIRDRALPVGLFALSLIGFIGLKVPHLSLPFFWDECGVYGHMVFHLADTGLSMHPQAISEWVSRGHPLFYPNLVALFCDLFGTHVTVAHAVNLGMAVLIAVGMFEALRRAISPWAGLLGSVSLMVQPLFFTQSVFVLPEIALTLFLGLATVSFIKRWYWVYLLSGSAAILTKEPAIVWIGALFLWDLPAIRRSRWWQPLIWLTPVIPFGIFLVAQKLTLGWYFFPYHAQGFALAPDDVLQKLTDYGQYLFAGEGRVFWTALVFAAGIRLLLTRHRPEQGWGAVLRNRYVSALFAGAAYMLFSSTTFYHERYILVVFLPLCALMAVLVYAGLWRRSPIAVVLQLAVCSFLTFQYFMSSPTFRYDLDMSYVRSIRSTQHTIRYMLDNGMMEPDEFYATIPVHYATMDPRYGYLPEGVSARFPRPVHAGTRYVVKVIPGTEIENPDNYPLEQITEWTDSDIRTIIYRVLPGDTLPPLPE